MRYEGDVGNLAKYRSPQDQDTVNDESTADEGVDSMSDATHSEAVDGAQHVVLRYYPGQLVQRERQMLDEAVKAHAETYERRKALKRELLDDLGQLSARSVPLTRLARLLTHMFDPAIHATRCR